MGRKQIEGIGKQSVEKNIWTKKKDSIKRLEKTA
jgi:hypothetical protein